MQALMCTGQPTSRRGDALFFWVVGELPRQKKRENPLPILISMSRCTTKREEILTNEREREGATVMWIKNPPMPRLRLYLFASLVLGGGVTCFQSPIRHHRQVVVVTSLNAADDYSSSSGSVTTTDELKAGLFAYLKKREEANADDVAKS